MSDASENLSDIWRLKRRGKRDSERHKELVKKAIRENGKDLITEYNIIKSDGKKKVKVPIRFLDKYHFKYGKLRNKKGTGQGVDVKKGSKYRARKIQSGPPGPAGDKEGEQIYEASITIDELVEILLEQLDLPWMDPKNSTIIEVESEEISSIDRNGILPNLDLRRTLYENIKRNAAKGDAKIGGFIKEDFRYKTWEEEKEYHSNAAVYLMMDRSGSMDPERTYIAKSFYFWMVQFLKRRYKNIELVFIAHDTRAFICEEEDFFKISPSGGTMCSSAFKLAHEHIIANHSPDSWNNYVFEFSDGDNFMADNVVCVDYAKKLLPLCRAIGYGEIILDDTRPWMSEDRLLSNYFNKEINRTRFVSMQLSSRDDVFDSLKKFFNINTAVEED
jgi:sporulation protein YhbH